MTDDAPCNADGSEQGLGGLQNLKGILAEVRPLAEGVTLGDERHGTVALAAALGRAGPPPLPTQKA